MRTARVYRAEAEDLLDRIAKAHDLTSVYLVGPAEIRPAAIVWRTSRPTMRLFQMAGLGDLFAPVLEERHSLEPAIEALGKHLGR